METNSSTAALDAPRLLGDPEARHLSRRWQGIPSIERAPGGRLWAAWYSGGDGEGPENFVVLYTSGDDGVSWSGPALVIDPPGSVRAFDPCLWHDPDGRLWVFWAQSYGLYDGRCGVWAVRCDDSGAPDPRWSEPRRLCHGIMMNKPTVVSTGEWLLPAAIWPREPPPQTDNPGSCPLPPAERLAGVVRSTDRGRTWRWTGGADMEGRGIDEHMIVERHHGELWMLVRTRYGIGLSRSVDGGRSWTAGEPSGIPGPDSRFFIRRLASGAQLLVNHHRFTGRSHLTALVSDDDGKTWAGGLLLDGRSQVSYPDGVESPEGRIYVVHDHDRHGSAEILLSVFTEADVRAGMVVHPGTRIATVVHRLSGSTAREPPSPETSG